MENKEVEALKGLSIHLSELQLNPDLKCDPGVFAGNFRDWQCYKITSTNSGHGAMDAQKFFATLAIKFKSDHITWYYTNEESNIYQMTPPSLHFLMMSEENAYGLPAGKKFFDGLIEKDICKSRIFPSSGGLIKITKVSEYHHIPSTCSPDSYYQCLAKHFAEINFKNPFLGKTFNRSQCQFKELCSPFSLPLAQREIAFCKNDEDRICYQKVIEDLMMNQTKDCKKLCHVKEFKYGYNEDSGDDDLSVKYGKDNMRFFRKWIYENWNWTEYDSEDSFILEYSFEQEELSKETALQRRNHRSMEPLKSTYSEYWIVSDMALVGNVGGMFGLFIGFSFLGLFESVMDVGAKVWARIKKFV